LSSDKIDKWVEKNPESWAKLAKTSDKKETFKNFKKKFMKGAKESGKYGQVKHMTDSQLKRIYDASGVAKETKIKIEPEAKAFKTKRITVKRQGKTYKRTVAPRWEKTTTLSLKLVADLKPRSPEYNRYVANLIVSTGRTRQAVIKKIQRTRKGGI